LKNVKKKFNTKNVQTVDLILEAKTKKFRKNNIHTKSIFHR